MVESLASFNAKMGRLGDEFAGRALRAIAEDVGKASKVDVADAVRGDLGDLSMSNWRRSRPIQITGRYDLEGEGQVAIMPARRALGPMRVLEEGRKAGMSKARRRRRSRPVSSSPGKGTWSDALSIMQREVPGRVARAVNGAVRRSLRG
jgi:hypothetical protein